ncbi:MAG: glycosyltransferase [Gemmatimonadota bacterium]|nr:glycosyltransferase [Gemmatimonadota bacterium]
MSRVSLIVPTYNCAPYLVEAIESVLNQTYKAAEIIVVDDGSTDNTEEVLKSYVEKGFVRYIRQNKQGPGSARNVGIRSATGDYIAFLDADDALTENSLGARVALLQAFPQMSFVFSDYFHQDQESSDVVAVLKKERFLEKFAGLASNTSNGRLFSSASFDDVFDIPFFAHANTVLVRRATLDKVGLFRTDIVTGEDTDMWLRLAKNGVIGYVDAPLAYYKRFRGTLTTKDPLKYGEDRLRFLDVLQKEHASFSNASSVISRRLGLVHYDLGCHYYGEKKILQAQRYFLKSILSNPRSLLPYKALVFSFVPSRWRRWAARWARRMN